MKSFEHYSKQTKRAVESAFSDQDVKDWTIQENLAALLDGNSSKFSRTVALLSLVRRLAPIELKYNYQKEDLAVSPDRYEFKEGAIGRGGENDVYLLEAQNEDAPSWVIKVNRQDRGDVAQLTARAKEIKADYEDIKESFRDLPDLIPPEYTAIMTDPRDNKPAIITLQPYLGRDLRDLFRKTETDPVGATVRANPNLQADLRNFLRINEEKLQSSGKMIDLIGPRNLVLVKSGGQDRLLVLDPHLISNPLRSEESTKKKQRERLNYLYDLLGETSAMEWRRSA